MGRETDKRVLETLDQWHKDSLPGPIELYARLMRIQAEAKSTISFDRPHLPAEAISERLRRGTPVLAFDELQLEWGKIDSLFAEALSVIGEYFSLGPSPSTIPLQEMARAWYEGEPMSDGDEEEPLLVALNTALKPFLAAQAEALLPYVDQSLWRRGYCPICGSAPNLAVLRGEGGARWLVCARCDAEWRFQRLQCPFCGTKEQGSLGYFPDAQGLYRLYVCEECKGYIKGIDLRHSQSEVLIPLEWISTLDLDRQACELGYKAGELTTTNNSEEAL